MAKSTAPETKDAKIGPRNSLQQEFPDIQQLLLSAAGSLLVGVLYLQLPDQYTIGPNWVLLVLVALLIAPVLAHFFMGHRLLPKRAIRALALTLLAALTAALVGSVVLLINALFTLSKLTAAEILRPAVLLWITNVLVFATWYWETDGGGPHARLRAHHEATDFLFPQQVGGNATGWAPGFVDYLFLAFCSATALSPADTMPLTRRAKMLMMAEAIISLVVIVMLIARSVNIIR